MILYIVATLLLADFSAPSSPDTVIHTVYSPLLKFDPHNVLFSSWTTKHSERISQCGVSPAFCSVMISHGILKHHLITKSVNTLISQILLLSSGDIERNPGPLDGGRYQKLTYMCTIHICTINFFIHEVLCHMYCRYYVLPCRIFRL